MLSQTYAQRAGRLGFAQDKSAQFFQAANALSQGLQQAEAHLHQLTTTPSANNVESIRAIIDQLHNLRLNINQHALERDELNRTANELCQHAQPQQSAAIRAPLHALNERFNKMYAVIGEYQHRLERSLLDLGQYEQASEERTPETSLSP
jgi:ABC-type transporter Mla subunit MlaD